MRELNYYDILGVDRKTSEEDIKLAYRKLAKKHHPDANRNNPENDVVFKNINEAYNILSDYNKKRKYDKIAAKYGFGGHEKDLPITNLGYELKNQNVFSEIISTILGINKQKETKEPIPIKGKDITSFLDITMYEGLRGIEKKIAVKGVNNNNNISVKVPIGIKNGEKIRLAALGKKGRNGGKNGDLIITVNILRDKEFSLKGIDLNKDIYISPAEAVCGTKIKINLFGSTVYLDIPNNTKNNEILTFEDYGYISKNGRRGNLNLKVIVTIPKELSEREINLYNQLYKLEKKKLKKTLKKM